MHRSLGPFRVFVGLVPTGYLNPPAIAEIVQEGIAFCGAARRLAALKPGPKIVLRTDVPLADEKIGRYGYTHPEIARAAITGALTRCPAARIFVVDDSSPYYPTSRMLKKATGQSEAFRTRGYYELEHLFAGRVEIAPVDETPAYRYRLSKGPLLSPLVVLKQDESALAETYLSRASNEIATSRHFFDADFAIYCPKIKSNALTHGFSGAISLGGSRYTEQDIFNDHRLCDALEVCNPGLVVSDGIIAAIGGNPATERGHELGVILVANNALAHDWVAAQILNLDPMKIPHLKIACERGWGPLSTNQIELGGAGAEGVHNLNQKSRYWDLGYLPVEEFRQKFETENSGLGFPLEILSGSPAESAGAHGLLLNWLYLTYDNPARRRLMAFWPQATLCVGNVRAFPSNAVVYAVGWRAIESMAALTSSSREIFRFRGVTGRRVQLKNGRRHLLIEVPGRKRQAPWRRKPHLLLTTSDLTTAFSIGSLGRMTSQLFRLGLAADRLLFRLRAWWNAPKRTSDTPSVMTSRMPQNTQWSLSGRNETERTL